MGTDGQYRQQDMVGVQARKDAIEARLQQIRASDAGELIRQLWEEHHGVICAGVYWDKYSEPYLLHAHYSIVLT